jgi:hypothetical protein
MELLKSFCDHEKKPEKISGTGGTMAPTKPPPPDVWVKAKTKILSSFAGIQLLAPAPIRIRFICD